MNSNFSIDDLVVLIQEKIVSDTGIEAVNSLKPEELYDKMNVYCPEFKKLLIQLYETGIGLTNKVLEEKYSKLFTCYTVHDVWHNFTLKILPKLIRDYNRSLSMFSTYLRSSIVNFCSSLNSGLKNYNTDTDSLDAIIIPNNNSTNIVSKKDMIISPYIEAVDKTYIFDSLIGEIFILEEIEDNIEKKLAYHCEEIIRIWENHEHYSLLKEYKGSSLAKVSGSIKDKYINLFKVKYDIETDIDFLERTNEQIKDTNKSDCKFLEKHNLDDTNGRNQISTWFYGIRRKLSNPVTKSKIIDSINNKDILIINWRTKNED